jgi:hypothetical protein
VLRFDGSYVDEATLDRLIRRCRTATYDPREPLTSAVLVEAVAAGRLREHQDGAALVEALCRALTEPGQAQRMRGVG